jgi:hypothetical protein
MAISTSTAKALIAQMTRGTVQNGCAAPYHFK